MSPCREIWKVGPNIHLGPQENRSFQYAYVHEAHNRSTHLRGHLLHRTSCTSVSKYVCICSLRYPACNAHAPYCHLCPAPLYNILPSFLARKDLEMIRWLRDLADTPQGESSLMYRPTAVPQSAKTTIQTKNRNALSVKPRGGAYSSPHTD